MTDDSCAPILEEIVKHSRTIQKLAQAADACHYNYNWLRNQKSAPIHLLDFDIICGCVTPLGIARWAEGTADRIDANAAGDGDALLNCGVFLGSSSLSHLLKSIDDYALPPGTQIELFSWGDRVAEQTSLSGRRVLDLLQRLRSSSNPIEEARHLVGSHDFAAALRRKLVSLDAKASEIALLKRLVARQVPLSKCLGARPKELDEYARMFTEALHRKRPNKNRQNECDALNAMTLSWMMISPDRHHKFIPFLISDTEPVNELSGLQQALNLGLDHGVSLFNSADYLLLTVALRERNDNRMGSMINDASLLAAELRAYLKELNRVWKGPMVSRQSLLTSPAWHLLHAMSSRIERQWGDMFSSIRSRLEADAVEGANSLLSPKTEQLITQLQTAETASQRSLIGAIHRNVLSQVYYNVALRPLFFEEGIYNCHAISAPLSDLFTVSYNPEKGACGQMLRNSRPSFPVRWDDANRLTDLRNQQLNTIRFNVHSKWFSPDEAVVAVDYRRSRVTGKTFVTVKWLHSLPIMDCANAALSVFEAGESLAGLHQTCLTTIFSKSSPDTVEGPLANLPSRLKRLCQSRRDIDSMEVTVDDVTFFCDFTSLVDVEFQMGMSADASQWGESLMASTVEAIARWGIKLRHESLKTSASREIMRVLTAVIRKVTLPDIPCQLLAGDQSGD